MTTTQKTYGYARVSTIDQDLTLQEEALKAAGCDDVRSEKVSGTSRENRRELETLLRYLRSGDTLVVTRLDRLGRSLLDLQEIAKDLEGRGINLKVLEQAVDTSTSAGKAFFGMLGVFAQFETDLRRERQMEGIAKAKAEGRYNGRPATVDREKVLKMVNVDGVAKAEVARVLGINRTTVHRIVNESR